MNLINTLEKLEHIVTKYNHIIGNESKSLLTEYALQDSVTTQKALQTIEEENRLLQIGIIGRVKAGKSSLLNALLFEGKSILPKAATPMTAALTIISYGDTLSSEVEFFSQSDINNIKNEHAAYVRELERLTQNKLEEIKNRKAQKNINNPIISDTDIEDLRAKAEKQAKLDLKSKIELNAAYDQYNKMQSSEINPETLGTNKIIIAPTVADLSEQLLAYVGADGKYMPFTKSVHIKLPLENLKDIQIIDTPGVNDPVQSREERTRELLKFCDAVLIVSPAGQFMSHEDMELMDRITSKEGIRELYVIASQVDLQLFGHIKLQNDGDLHRASKAIVSDLANHLHETLTNLKKSNPEIGTTYDQLIDQSRTKVIHSSGMCLSIKETWDAKETWDEGTKKTWENLSTNYPDYFSNSDRELSKSNLHLLANIASINTIIEDVKEKKEEILKKREKDFLKAKMDSLVSYKNELLKYIGSQIDKIHNSDIDELRVKQKNLENVKDKVSIILDDEYYDIVRELELNIKNKLTNTLDGYFKGAKKSVSDAEGSTTESYEVSTSHWYNPLSWGSTETKYNTYITARTGAIRSALEELTSNVESQIDIDAKEFILNWKKNLAPQLIKTMRDYVDDNDLDPHQIQKVIRNVINSVIYPDISYSNRLPESLSSKGILSGVYAENFLQDAQEYISKLRTVVRNDINSYLSSLVQTLEKVKMSESLFSNYNTILEELENQIKNQAVILDSFDRLKKDLVEVV